MTKFSAVRRSVTQHKPSCILALHCLLACEVSSTDFKLTTVPMIETFCELFQTVLRQCAHIAISLPSWFSDVILCAPLSAGGLGFPVLHIRVSIHRTLITLRAACSRSVYTRKLVQALLYDQIWDQLRGSDPVVLNAELQARRLHVSVNPEREVGDDPVQGAWYKAPIGDHVVAVSGGSAADGAMGCAVVFLDTNGVLGAF